EDEVVFGEAADGMGPERDLHLAVVHAEIGMVALRLRQLGHPLDEGDAVQKGVEDEGFHQSLAFHLPARHLREQGLLLLLRERGDASLAGEAALLSEIHSSTFRREWQRSLLEAAGGRAPPRL